MRLSKQVQNELMRMYLLTCTPCFTYDTTASPGVCSDEKQNAAQSGQYALIANNGFHLLGTEDDCGDGKISCSL